MEEDISAGPWKGDYRKMQNQSGRDQNLEPRATHKELQIMCWRIKARGKVIPLISKFREIQYCRKDRFVHGEVMEKMLMESHF